MAGKIRAKRIVIKIGTAILTKNGRLDINWIKKKVKEISNLQKKGKEIIIITSGAVGAGMITGGLKKRPKETIKLQLLAGKGQPELFRIYNDNFRKHGINTAQILLTHHNFSNKIEEKTVENIIKAYLNEKTVSIINENDMVSKEEFTGNSLKRFTDNDGLAALVAENMKADLLLILTDVHGLYSGNPKKEKKARLLKEVSRITNEIEKMATKEKCGMSLGGMSSKVHVAKRLAAKGITTIVAHGNSKLDLVLKGKAKRTVFLAD